VPDLPPLFYAVAIFAILLTGVSKSGFGGGAAGIAVPLMSIFIAPPEAAAIMLPILCAMDIFGVHAYRGRWSREHLAILLPGRAGRHRRRRVRVRRDVAERDPAGRRQHRGRVRAQPLVQAVRALAARLAASRKPPGRVAGAFWGALSGFTSTLAHAGGPPFVIYMLPHKPDKTTFVATSVVFFLIVNYVKLVPYYFLGQLNVENLATSLLFAPLAPIGIWLGVWLHKHLTEGMFYSVTNLLLFTSGAKLVWDALA
jgi:uncharacterized membrane protein YfcA